MRPEDYFKRRSESIKDRRENPLHFEDDYGSTQCPVVYHFLAAHEVNGKGRILGKIIVFAEDGRLKCCLKDADNAQVLFTTVGSMETLWNDLEAALTSPDADWRDQGSQRGRKS